MTPKKKITIEKLACNRCGKNWWPRINDEDKPIIPIVCPQCKSNYWNKERKLPKRDRK